MHNVWALCRMLVRWCHSPVWKTLPSGDQSDPQDSPLAYDKDDKGYQHRHTFHLGMQSRVARPISRTLAPFLTFRNGYLLSQEQILDTMTANRPAVTFDS